MSKEPEPLDRIAELKQFFGEPSPEDGVVWIRQRETVLAMIARLERYREALEDIAKMDMTSEGPTVYWLADWRNKTKRKAAEALKENENE